jgi:hypothetical protein
VKSFLVYRHGSNAANQSMTPVAAVAIVDADTIESARKIASENVLCYSNQHLELVEEPDADTEDWNDVVERSAQLSACGEESIIFSA